MEKSHNLPEFDPDVRELSHRPTLNGLEKFLLWHKESNAISVLLRDEKENKLYAFEVPPDKALDAFEHPFAYKPDECNGVPLWK